MALIHRFIDLTSDDDETLIERSLLNSWSSAAAPASSLYISAVAKSFSSSSVTRVNPVQIKPARVAKSPKVPKAPKPAKVPKAPKPAPVPKVRKDDLPHVLIWVCHHGPGQNGKWTQNSLRIVGVYGSKAGAEGKKRILMSQHECCGHGDILVGDSWSDEIDLIVRPAGEVDM